jgi:signal transduction histidine kinase
MPEDNDNDMTNARTAELAQPAGHRSRVLATSLLTAPFQRRTWAELAYLAATVPLTAAGFGVLIPLLFASAGLAVIAVGVPLAAAVVLGARLLARLHLRLASILLGEDLQAIPPFRPTAGLRGWVRPVLGDIAGWRAVAYVVLRTPVAVAGAYVVVALWVYYGLLDLLAPLWVLYHRDQETPKARPFVLRAPTNAAMLTVRTVPGTLVLLAIGIAALLAAPWAVRAMVAADRVLARAVFGPSRISGRIRELEQTRARAIDDSAAALRKIERDLHDGPQVRLAALAMFLGEVKESLHGTPIGDADGGSRIRALVDAAHRNAGETLAELRDLARGIHPPLLDRGLEAALSTLTAASATPATLTVALQARPSPAIETIAYFCAAELLANVAKHSGAHHAAISVTDHSGRIVMTVTDDGRGAARPARGGGLAGLAERIRTVDGRLSIDSPPGGPTTITVDLPEQA